MNLVSPMRVWAESRTVIRLPRPLYVLLLAALCVGCWRSEDRTISRHVGTRELIGEWKINDTGRRDLADSGFEELLEQQEFRLTLSEGGRCVLDSPLVSGCGPADARVTRITPDLPCRWTLEVRGRHQSVDLVIDQGAAGRRFHDLHITKEGGRLILFDYICDPDLWDYVEYEKVAGESGSRASAPAGSEGSGAG